MARHSTVSIEEIAGVAPQLDDTDKLAVSVYGNGGAAGDTSIPVSLAGADGVANTVDGMRTVPMLMLFNGTTWDRQRNNEEVTLLASAERNAAISGPTQVNHNARGVMLFLDVTANPGGAETLTVVIQTSDSIGTFTNDITSDLVITAANGSRVIILYPGAVETSARANYFTQGLPLPRGWRAHVTHSGAGNWTYSLGACCII